MNIAALVGRLTKDPELKYTPSGVANCNFILAVDNPFGDKETDFIQIVVWKQLAEACCNYLRKGRLCAIDGRIKTRKYEKDGRTVYVTEIIANNVKFLEKAGDSNSGQQQSNQQNNQKDPFINDGTPIDISDDDLPF